MKEKEEIKNTENKMFPELSEAGSQEAIQLIEKFKSRISQAADEVIGLLYSEILPHIESDSWYNFRRGMLSGLRDYNYGKNLSNYDFKEIRKQMFKEYKEEITKDLNQDLLEEIKSLKQEIENLDRRYNNGY